MDLWRLFKNPDQFLLEFEDTDAIFVDMDRDAYYRSIFCDRRISPRNRNLTRVACAHLYEFRDQYFCRPPNLSYIFHMAHCGSTLLARALDIKEANIVYREPFALRQLGVEAASISHGEKAPTDWQRRLNLITALLGRSYNKEGTVIVKANVPVNFMIPQLLEIETDAHAILLYFSLDNYLLAILRTPSHRNWIARIIAETNLGISANIGVQQNLTLPQAAACLWMAQIMIFAKVISDYPLVRSLNAEDLFNDPRLVLQHAFDYFGQEFEGPTIEKIVSGELFTRYSKNPERQFDNESRLARRRELKKEITHEMKEGRDWVERQLEIYSIPRKLPNSLTGESADLLTPA
jgi:hypothetical protein